MLSSPVTENLVDVIKSGLSTVKTIDQKGRMYASSSAYCARQTALNMTYTGKELVSASTQFYFGLGVAAENIVVDGFRARKKLLYDSDEQYKLPDLGLNLGGKIDCIIEHNQKILGIEVKTCGKLPEKPQQEHVAQATLYSAVLQIPFSIVYVSRNVNDYYGNLQIKEFMIDCSNFNHEQALKTVVFGKFMAEAGYMPDIPAHITNDSDCGFCRFKSICWGSEQSHLDNLSKMDTSEFSEIAQLTNDKVKDILSTSNRTYRYNGLITNLVYSGTPEARKLVESVEFNKSLTSCF